MIDIDKTLARVPEYDRFYTLDEMFANAREAANKHPDLVKYEVVGKSTDGEDLPMLRIGNGEQRLLLFASPHPNEPIGAMLIQFLLEELVANPELVEGRSWYLLPCVDPDGTRLNEGWFAGPFTVRNYARNFYRPRSQEQVEWTFPIKYKDFEFNSPMPETQALMRAFDKARPQFVYSLHNAGFGGVYYYISHDITDAYNDFTDIPTKRGLVMSLGEPEMPWAVEFAPAVYKMASVREHYDYLEQYSDGSPASKIQGGASSSDYLSEGKQPVMLVTELPYFQSPQISNTSPIDRTRREVLLAGIEKTKQASGVLQGLLNRIDSHMTLDTRFYRAVVSFAKYYQNNAESEENWAATAGGLDGPATVAQEVDALYVATFYRLLVASMLRRAIEAQLRVSPLEELSAALSDLEGHLETWAVEVESNLDYTAVPIKKLVEVQYGALLALLNSKQFLAALPD